MSPRQRHQRRGFSLVELLVVIGIFGVLIGLVLPAIFRSQRNSRIAVNKSTLASIATALEAYRADHGSYPRIGRASGFSASTADRPLTPTGAEILCRALIAPAAAFEPVPPANSVRVQDGADSFGFRTRDHRPGPDGAFNTADDELSQGKVYGPYLNPDKFKVKMTSGSATVDGSAVIADSNDIPIVYLPKTPWPSTITAADGFVSENDYNPATPVDNAKLPMWNFYDARSSFTASSFTRTGSDPPVNALKRMQAMLGDIDCDGSITGSETAAYTGSFILWAAGDDGQFGPEVATAPLPLVPTKEMIVQCDDAIHFKE